MNELAAAVRGRMAPQGFVLPALQFVAAYVLLTALMYAWGGGYSSAWRKPFEAAIAALPSTVRVKSVDVAQLGDQRVFVLRAQTRDAMRTPRGIAPAGIKLQSTTLQAYAHHHLILILAAVVAWPVRRPVQRAMHLAAGVAAVAVSTMLDLPFALLGVMQDTLLAASAPERLGADAYVLYFAFLQGGGRYALSLASAGLAMALVGRK